MGSESLGGLRQRELPGSEARLSTLGQDTWRTGAVIVQEEYFLRQLVTVRPVTVVEDSDEVLALYSHAGASYRSGAMRNRQQIPVEERVRVYLSEEQPRLEDRAVSANVLTLNPPGASHSIWFFGTVIGT